MGTTTFAPIFLSGAPSKAAPSPRSGVLEVIAAGFTEPTTFIRSPSEAISKVRKRKQRIQSGDIQELKKVNREILTKAVAGLAAVAAGATAAGRGLVKAVAPKLVPTTLPSIIGTTTAGGILLTSPTARGFVGEFLRDPLKVGAKGGELIERAVAGQDIPFIEAAKAAGLLGAGVAAVVGGKKLLDKIPDRVPKVSDPSSSPTSIALPNAVVPTALSPISDAPVVAPTVDPAKLSQPSMGQPINVKVISKPQINVAVAQST